MNAKAPVSSRYRNVAEWCQIVIWYGSRTAQRSGVPLIEHINDGIEILEGLKASPLAIRAYCLHPLTQNNAMINLGWSDALPLAEEYAVKANAYLCRPETDYVRTVEQLQDLVGEMSQDCALMLLADKLQNSTDFQKYHADTHPRRHELTRYFDLWIAFLHNYLGMNPQQVKR
jgi:hypothetical protein